VSDPTPDRPDDQPPADPGEPRRNPPPPLLESLMRDTLDPGYAKAAKRRATGGAPSARSSAAWLVSGLLVVGLLLAVAFRSAQAGSAGDNLARDALVADVQEVQAEQSALVESAASLAEQVRSAQATAGGELAQLTALEEMNALVAVTGPGLSISLDDPNAAGGNAAVLDRDLQLLVNSLWSAGAEAIAVNGVRLRVTTAIRQAGGAILVDNRPVSWPMTIEAIGDPDGIHQRFINTTGFGRFSTFTQLYGVTFDVIAVDSVSLPAAAQVDPQYASAEPTSTAVTTPTTVTTSTS